MFLKDVTGFILTHNPHLTFQLLVRYKNLAPRDSGNVSRQQGEGVQLRRATRDKTILKQVYFSRMGPSRRSAIYQIPYNLWMHHHPRCVLFTIKWEFLKSKHNYFMFLPLFKLTALSCFHIKFPGFRLLMYTSGKMNDNEISLNFRYIYPILRFTLFYL